MVSLYLIVVGLVFGFTMGLYVSDTPNRRRRKWEKRNKQRNKEYERLNKEGWIKFKKELDKGVGVRQRKERF